MSSGRRPLLSTAVVVQGDRACGPMHLPAKNTQRFIDQFNRQYDSIGLKIQSVATASEQLQSSGDDVPAPR